MKTISIRSAWQCTEGVMNAFQYGNEQRRERKIYVVFELLHEKV